jgi:p-aminobenzoyl-glutamate transporter AbgT
MNDGLGIIIFIVVWFVVMKFILPRLGVPT